MSPFPRYGPDVSRLKDGQGLLTGNRAASLVNVRYEDPEGTLAESLADRPL